MSRPRPPRSHLHCHHELALLLSVIIIITTTVTSTTAARRLLPSLGGLGLARRASPSTSCSSFFLAPPTPPPCLRCTTTTRRWSSSSSEPDDGETPSPAPIPSTRVPNKILPGTIYFVATPLGNLGDITLRALDVLRGVDLIASEDTRTTGLLLKALGLEKKKQISHHQHNTQGRVPELVQKAQLEKLSIAVVSDAGTPGISDPGNELAAACWEAGVPLVPVPGVCAAIAAVSVAGFISTEFIFYGFLPAKGGKNRKVKLAEIAEQGKPCILYESPNRVVRTLMELRELDDSGGEREVLCARELTKLHEELFRGTLTEAIEHFGGGGGGGEEGNDKKRGGGTSAPPPPRGEFTLVVGPCIKRVVGAEEIEAEVRGMLRVCQEEEGLSTSEAVKKVTRSIGKEVGFSKSDVYKLALEMKGE